MATMEPAFRARAGRAEAWPRRGEHDAKARLTPVSWEASGRLDLADWVAVGRRLGSMGRGIGWWIGDWINYGNAAYGERYVPASRVTGYDVQTLANMAYVASRFETSRRREVLSWSHHAELSALEEDEQEAWLDRVERDRLSVRCLRIELRGMRARDRGESRQLASGERTTVYDALAEVTCPNCGHRFPGADD